MYHCMRWLFVSILRFIVFSFKNLPLTYLGRPLTTHPMSPTRSRRPRTPNFRVETAGALYNRTVKPSFSLCKPALLTRLPGQKSFLRCGILHRVVILLQEIFLQHSTFVLFKGLNQSQKYQEKMRKSKAPNAKE